MWINEALHTYKKLILHYAQEVYEYALTSCQAARDQDSYTRKHKSEVRLNSIWTQFSVLFEGRNYEGRHRILLSVQHNTYPTLGLGWTLVLIRKQRAEPRSTWVSWLSNQGHPCRGGSPGYSGLDYKLLQSSKRKGWRLLLAIVTVDMLFTELLIFTTM